MDKLSLRVVCLLAGTMFAAVAAHAQSSGSGSGAGTGGTSGTSAGASGSSAASSPSGTSGASGTTGSDGTQSALQGAQRGSGQQGITAPQQQGLTQGSGQATGPTELQPQTGPRQQSLDPGVQTRRNYTDPSRPLDERQSGALQTREFDSRMSPPDRGAGSFDAEMQSDRQYGDGSSIGPRDEFSGENQIRRAELGVWLMSSGNGVEVRSVTAGSAAAQIGLRPGDLLLGVNGQRVLSPFDVQRIIRNLPPGQTTTLDVWRDGVQQEVPVTLQPIMADRYQVGYRGAEGSAPDGDLAMRTARLEEQLNRVVHELQQIRHDMAQRHIDTTRAPVGTALGNEPGAVPRTSGPIDELESQPETSLDNELTEPVPSATEPRSPATSTDTQSPAADAPSATSGTGAIDESTDELFSSEPAPTDTETSPADETESEIDTNADADLFQ